jgi:hypothetical protein
LEVAYFESCVATTASFISTPIYPSFIGIGVEDNPEGIGFSCKINDESKNWNSKPSLVYIGILDLVRVGQY